MSHTKCSCMGHLFMYVKKITLMILNNGHVYITRFFRGPRRPCHNGVVGYNLSLNRFIQSEELAISYVE